MGPKVFTLQEANAIIPRIEEIFEGLDGTRDRLKQVKSKMDVLEMLWGEEILNDTNPDHREYEHYLEDLEDSKKQFEKTAKKISEMDALLKSVEQGLVDFYSVMDSRLVFLCWKRGEKSIEYWHHLEDGFGGRQPIQVEDGVQ